MRDYRCYYDYRNAEGNWLKSPNISCWAGIDDISRTYPGTTIRISKWKCPETKKYAKLLTRLINKITPCYISEGYIYYKLLTGEDTWEWYDRNLFVLNFIRYLWNFPDKNYGNLDFDTYSITASTVFFTELAKSRYRDPMMRLTKANKLATAVYTGGIDNGYRPGHSNINSKAKTLSTEFVLMNEVEASKIFN